MTNQDLVMRLYEVCYCVPQSPPPGVCGPVPDMRVTKRVYAAYWAIDGDTRIAQNNAVLDFISFKDTNHKHVFTVRRNAVQSVEEIPQASPYADIIDADSYRTASGAAWDHGKILAGVLRGRLAVDSARTLLGLKPFNLPQTLHPFAYAQCPNGCVGAAACTDCPV